MAKDLFEEMRKAQDEMESLFEHFFHLKRPFALESKVGWKPLVDVYETQDSVIVTIELAGVSSENINLAITKTSLTVKGVRVDPAPRDGEHERVRRAVLAADAGPPDPADGSDEPVASARMSPAGSTPQSPISGTGQGRGVSSRIVMVWLSSSLASGPVRPTEAHTHAGRETAFAMPLALPIHG